jgi:RNA-directed DNA polymerase
MGVEQQQGTWTQLSLFEEGVGSVRPGASGEGGTGSAATEEWQASTALKRERALTGNLMERICERENLNRAYKRSIAWFRAQGLVSLSERYAELQP